MTDPVPSRSITVAQVVGILASTLVLFFLIAFATKALDAHRLKSWRDRLQGEIAAMQQERQALEAELDRRRSTAWAEEALRDAGQVTERMVGVVAVTATPNPQSGSAAPVLSTPTPSSPPGAALFANPNWQAWRRLILGGPE